MAIDNEPFEDRLEGVFQVAALIPRYREGLLSPEEMALLNRWLGESEAHRAWFRAMTTGDIPADKLESIKDFDAGRAAALARVSQRLDSRAASVRRSRTRRLAIGTLLALLVGGVFLFYHFTRQSSNDVTSRLSVTAPAGVAPGTSKATLVLANGQSVDLDSAHQGVIAAQPGHAMVINHSGRLAYTTVSTDAGGNKAYNTISTSRGGQYQVVLPDGTKVWLDAASSLRYPTAFTGNTREVTLVGQAYFEVADNKSQPFSVKVADQTVKVLGTHFNIMAYGDEPRIETTLLQGAVVVRSPAGEKKLYPGEQASTGAGGGLTVAKVDTGDFIAWKNGLIRLRHAGIRTVLQQISRWYDVDIAYDLHGKPLPTWTWAGTMPRTLSFGDVMKILELNGLHCRLDTSGKNTLVVSV